MGSFTPLPWQVAPWRSVAGTMLLTGAAGGGKSRLAAEKIHAYMLKYPGATGIVGRKDRSSALRSVVPLLRHTVMGDTDWGEYKTGTGLFQYHNGSQLWVAGLKDEGQRENLRSIGQDGSADITWFEEANKLKIEDHQEIAARMRGTKGAFRQMIYSTNPDDAKHWIKVSLIDGKQADVHLSRPEDNPTNPLDYLERLQNLTGVQYQRLWLGQWVQAEGIILTEFDSMRHVLEEIPYDRAGRYICSVDFGFTHPFSWSLWYIDHDGRMFQLAQIYHTKRLVEDHAKDIRRRINSLGLRVDQIEAWVCDHDAEDRATLERHLDITTTAAYKAITVGLEGLETRLKEDRIFFLHSPVEEVDPALESDYAPTCTAEEVPGYVWSNTKQDQPIKERDHGIDEARYAVAHVDNLSSRALEIDTRATTSSYTDKRKSTGGIYYG